MKNENPSFLWLTMTCVTNFFLLIDSSNEIHSYMQKLKTVSVEEV